MMGCLMTNLPEKTYDKSKKEIEWVEMSSGECIFLADMVCQNCGSVGCPFLAISEYMGGFFSFCSHECRMDGLKIGGDMEPPTPENMAEVGLYFISPQPET